MESYQRVLKSKILLILLLSIMIISFSFADGDHDKIRSIDKILTEIRTSQGVATDKEIDADKVSNDLLDELGEAVMDERHPDSKTHEWMDDMMGGEGSESLESMHRMMGYRYLEGSSFWGWKNKGDFRKGGHMMGQGMMNWQGNNPCGALFGFGGGVFMWILFILLIAGIGFGIYFFVKKRTALSGNALETLKQRYAKGEISKSEFDAIKKDLQ